MPGTRTVGRLAIKRTGATVVAGLSPLISDTYSESFNNRPVPFLKGLWRTSRRPAEAREARRHAGRLTFPPGPRGDVTRLDDSGLVARESQRDSSVRPGLSRAMYAETRGGEVEKIEGRI